MQWFVALMIVDEPECCAIGTAMPQPPHRGNVALKRQTPAALASPSTTTLPDVALR